MRIVLGITGASGVVYGIRLAEELKKTQNELFIIVSDAAKKVIASEVPDGPSHLTKCGAVFSEHDLEATISSGQASLMPLLFAHAP